MSVPQSRDDFKQWCLTKLGSPVLTIDVDEQQIDDRIDEAIRFYWDFHMDGSEKIFYKYIVSQEDIDNNYITLPENIIGVVDLFPITGVNVTNNMFDIRYQIALNDLYTLTNRSLVPYYQAMQAIQLYEILLVGTKPMRYNRNNNILHIDMAWSDYLQVGNYIIVVAYQVIDPDTYVKMWSDRWLQRYSTTLIQEQWGMNLTKFINVPLPGGHQLNGQQILNDSRIEKAKLEQEMFSTYSPVSEIYIG
jgi:hypothetical protein